jgi:hypothetical protein
LGSEAVVAAVARERSGGPVKEVGEKAGELVALEVLAVAGQAAGRVVGDAEPGGVLRDGLGRHGTRAAGALRRELTAT